MRSPSSGSAAISGRRAGGGPSCVSYAGPRRGGRLGAAAGRAGRAGGGAGGGGRRGEAAGGGRAGRDAAPELRRREPPVLAGEDRAERRARQLQLEVLGAVLREDGDPVATRDAEAAPRLRGAGDPPVEAPGGGGPARG